MPLFKAHNVYAVNPETQAIDWRDGSDVVPVDLGMDIVDYSFPFWVTGLNRYDIAVFANIIDVNGVSEQGYLVTTTGSQARIVAPKLIELDESLLTPELAKRIATVTPEEIASLGIEHLVRTAKLRYPKTVGFTR